ncbi:hypothetical protein [Mycolicibacterium madagascariense]|nr:hypothetical protein [Mycolicibacterium madagascariense]
MSAIVGAGVDVDDGESSHGQAGHGRDELGASRLAAPVPMELGFTDAEAFHGAAQFGDVVVFAQNGREEIGTGVQVGT